MKSLAQSVTTVSFLLLAAFGILSLMNCSSVHSGEPLSEEENGNSSNNEDYWTPERLKEAKPLELPHPPPPQVQPSVPPHTSAPSKLPSDQAPGHQGEEVIPPDETNLLFEDGQTPKPL